MAESQTGKIALAFLDDLGQCTTASPSCKAAVCVTGNVLHGLDVLVEVRLVLEQQWPDGAWEGPAVGGSVHCSLKCVCQPAKLNRA